MKEILHETKKHHYITMLADVYHNNHFVLNKLFTALLEFDEMTVSRD